MEFDLTPATGPNRISRRYVKVGWRWWRFGLLLGMRRYVLGMQAGGPPPWIKKEGFEVEMQIGWLRIDVHWPRNWNYTPPEGLSSNG